MNRLPGFRLLMLALVWCSAFAGLEKARAQDDGAKTPDRQTILNSPQWKQTMRDFEEWSSVQQIYDKDQMAKLKQQLEQKVAGMSADQMTDFMDDLKQKLTILHSDEARDARKWLSETFAVAAPAYAEKLREKLPDIATLTAAQLQLQLDKYEDEMAAKRKYATDFAKEREDQAKQIREQRIRDQKARLQSEISSAAAARSNYNFSAPVQIRTYASYPSLWGGYRW